MLKVILGKPFLDEAMEELRALCTLIEVDESETFYEVVMRESDCDVIIAPLGHKMSSEMISNCSNLKLICSDGVGYDHIEVSAALKRGIYVVNTPNVLTNAVADFIWTLILCCARRIIEGLEFMQAGKFIGYDKRLLLGKELTGATIGIIGMGRIGEAVAKRAKGFGMNVVYFSRTRKRKLEEKLEIEYVTFEELAKRSDVVVPIMNYSQEVYHLFNKKVFEMMKKDAILVNASRGKVINEEALANHLENTSTFYAGLDVYEFEPEINEKFKVLKNVVCLPHIGSATKETRYKMAKMNIEDILLIEKGERPKNLVSEYR
ncbi:MAG: D-glycerate dehydrogenase [Fusobacteria bacterium]|nr:D-glycerate dehydrogenase [Fusobacteriota bacterium]